MGVNSLEDVHILDWLGRMIVQTGNMRSSKTHDRRKFLQTIHQLTRHHGVSFVPSTDTRTVCERVHRETKRAPLSSAAGDYGKPILAYVYNDPEEIYAHVRHEDREIENEFGKGHYADIIDFEEPNFADHRVIPVAKNMKYFDGKPRLVLVGGLNKTFTQEAFGPMGWFIAHANCVITKFARCVAIKPDGTVCGRPDAEYTARLLNLENGSFDGPKVSFLGKNGEVIGNRTYAPFCDKVVRPEPDGSLPERDWPFNYAPMCHNCFPKVPLEEETRIASARALDLALSNRNGSDAGSVDINRLREELKTLPQLEMILASLEDRGFERQGNLLVPKLYVKGELAGLYRNLPHRS